MEVIAQTLVGKLEEHNQQIQALTPTEESLSQVPDDSALPVTTFLSLSIFIFFFVVVFLGFLPLVIERFRDFKRFQMALLVAFVAGAIPLTMGMVLQRSGVLTKASVLETPQDIQVSGISTDSFRVTWETTDTQYGALRYGNEPFSEALEQTALEVGGLERTNEHSVVVKNLEPDTDYYFELLSGAHWFDQGGVLLSVHTMAR